MEKVNRFVVKYLLFSLPLHAILLVLGLWGGRPAALKILMDVLSWNMMAWLAVFVLFLAGLLFNPGLQRRFFESAARLAGVRERDERESLAIDRAGRYAYISTLCLLVVMLLFYSINISVGSLPPEKVVDGKHKYFSVGFGVALTDDKPAVKPDDKLKIFSNWDLPFSKWSLIFFVIAWHVLSFLYYLRRTNRYYSEM